MAVIYYYEICVKPITVAAPFLGISLRPFAYWDCGFESCRMH